MKEQAWDRLHKERSDRFWRRILPELRVAGNYLPGFFFVGLAALFLYDRLTGELAPSPWIPPACALLLAAAVAGVRVRTYVEPADPVFLMPAEAHLNRYFRRCLFAAWPGQLALAAAAALAVWPLYRVQGTAAFTDWLPVMAVLPVFKTVHLVLWWQEQHMADGRLRRLFAGLRFAAAFAAIAAGLRHGVAASLLLGGISLLVLALAVRLPARLPVHWHRLIALEDKARRSWWRFLRQMAEPEGARVPAADHPFTRLARLIRHRPDNACRYLYVLTWLRSPLFGMTVRWVATGVVLAALAGGIGVKAGIGVLFAAVLHVQLKELGRGDGAAERDVLLPLAQEQRKKAARQVRLAIWLIGAGLLAAPAGLSLAVWTV